MVDSTDRLADALNTIKNNERVGRQSCTVPSTKLIRGVLDIITRERYIRTYERISEGKVERIKVMLSNNINDVKAIKPRYAVGSADIQMYEERYIPSKNFGILIISTSSGIMTNKEARKQGIGGRLLAYVY